MKKNVYTFDCAGKHCVVQKISIPPPWKGFFLTPPIPLEILVKVHTFLNIFCNWSSRTPHSPGNSNPFCLGSMDIFWNCTLTKKPNSWMLLLLKSDARWPESPPKSSFTARAPCLNKLQYVPIFCSTWPWWQRSSCLHQIGLRRLLNSSIATNIAASFWQSFSNIAPDQFTSKKQTEISV